MSEIENFKPSLGDTKIYIFIGIGAFCAGILIGFKLAGGQKVQLEETFIEVTPDVIIPEPQETEVEND